MADLDLTELDRLEREMQGKVMSTNVGHIHAQLRPLLDLVRRQAEALREQAIMAHVAQDHCGQWRDCADEACKFAHSVVIDYRKAKGG